MIQQLNFYLYQNQLVIVISFDVSASDQQQMDVVSFVLLRRMEVIGVSFFPILSVLNEVHGRSAIDLMPFLQSNVLILHHYVDRDPLMQYYRQD